MCEIRYDHESVDYSTSAYQRMLETLSIQQNLENVKMFGRTRTLYLEFSSFHGFQVWTVQVMNELSDRMIFVV